MLISSELTSPFLVSQKILAKGKIIVLKTRLQEIITSEDKNYPFTDEKLASLLGKDDYHIARRTVAKYRENLNIQIAKLRREL